MNSYVLQFDDQQTLASFLKTSKAICSDFDTPLLTISCVLSDAEIELATSAYNASILSSVTV